MNKGGIRGGTRGGKDQFDWEDVKVDKDRENYLGHSLKASVGRWQKGRDLTWYNKESKVAGRSNKLQAELAALKRTEEEAMAAALGLKPPAPVKPHQTLTKQELADACRRRSKDDTEGMEERVKGVGYQSRRAQSMFVGTKSTTTKEGATIFEHDSKHNSDDKLKMVRTSRPSESELVSPTPAKQQEYGPSFKNLADSAGTSNLPLASNTSGSLLGKRKKYGYSSDHSTSPVRTGKNGKKKSKQKKKRKKRHNAADPDSEENWTDSDHSTSPERTGKNERSERKKYKKKKKDKKRKKYFVEESDSEDDWAEVPTSSKRKEHESYGHKSLSKKKKKRSTSPYGRQRSSSSESDREVWAKSSTRKPTRNRDTDSDHYQQYKLQSRHKNRQTERDR